MTGLMWFPQFAPDGQLAIRHTCEQSDGLHKYGWLKHDGTNFGSQEIVDKDFLLNTEFVKRVGGQHGGDWTARISGKEMVGVYFSLNLKKCPSSNFEFKHFPNFILKNIENQTIPNESTACQLLLFLKLEPH